MLARMEDLREAADPVSAWLECDSQARIILGLDLDVHWMNSAALRTLQDTNVFDIRAGKLHVRPPRWVADFTTFIRSAPATEALICIPHPSGAHILCAARSLDVGTSTRRVGLTLRYTARSLSFNGTALEQAFNLTAMERRVVEALFSGLTADQVGADFRISTGTVRAHIRHIYDKLSVGSREALFYKALPFFSRS